MRACAEGKFGKIAKIKNSKDTKEGQTATEVRALCEEKRDKVREEHERDEDGYRDIDSIPSGRDGIVVIPISASML